MAAESARALRNKQPPKTESQEKIDLSLLQKPIQLGISGALQVAKCLSGGTGEMRDLLLEECDLVFECRVCRNLFRSLANFIAHKRVYCQECHSDRNLHLVETKPSHQTLLLQPEPPKDRVKEKKPAAPSKLESKISSANKVPTGSKIGVDDKEEKEQKIDDEPVKKQTKTDKEGTKENGTIICEGTSDAYQLYTNAMKRQKQVEKDMSYSLVELEDVKGNHNAKKQNVILDASEDEVRQASKRKRGPSHADLALISENIDSHRIESGPDTRWFDKDAEMSEDSGRRINLRTRGGNGEVTNPVALKLSRRKDCDAKTLTCLKCKTKYSSLKTLHFHMMSLHAERRTFYPCIYCKSTFTQMKSVIRHMQRSHHCSKEYIEKVKNVINKHSFSKPLDEVDEYFDKNGLTAVGGIPSGLSLRVQKSTRKERHLDKMEEMEKKTSEALLQVTRKLKDKIRRQKDRTVDFGSGFSLHKCLNCNKTFAKKDSLSRHQAFCYGMEDQFKYTKRTKPVPCNKKPSSTTGKPTDNLKVSVKIEQCPNPSYKTQIQCSEKKQEVESKKLIQREKPEGALEAMDVKSEVSRTTVEATDGNNIAQKDETGTPAPAAEEKVVKSESGNIHSEGESHSDSDSDQMNQLGKKPSGKLAELEGKDLERIRTMINEESLKCLKCDRTYGSISNLHRHAVRHLGWKRFRCTLCEFTGYNRSECKTHLHRVHLEKASSNLNRFILDLEPEKMKAGVSFLSRVEAKRPSSVRILERMQQAGQLANSAGKRAENPGGSNIPSNFNISTRMSPRKFDIRPFIRGDCGAIMFTRSGSYVKPPLMQDNSSSDDKDTETEDDNEGPCKQRCDSVEEGQDKEKQVGSVVKQENILQLSAEQISPLTCDKGSASISTAGKVASKHNGLEMEVDTAKNGTFSTQPLNSTGSLVQLEGVAENGGKHASTERESEVVEEVKGTEVVFLVMDEGLKSEDSSPPAEASRSHVIKSSTSSPSVEMGARSSVGEQLMDGMADDVGGDMEVVSDSIE